MIMSVSVSQSSRVSWIYCSTYILPQIQELTLIRLTLNPEASRLCGKAVSSMTKLTSLKLCNMTIDDGFFQVLSESTSTSMVRIYALLPRIQTHHQSTYNTVHDINYFSLNWIVIKCAKSKITIFRWKYIVI